MKLIKIDEFEYAEEYLDLYKEVNKPFGLPANAGNATISWGRCLSRDAHSRKRQQLNLQLSHVHRIRAVDGNYSYCICGLKIKGQASQWDVYNATGHIYAPTRALENFAWLDGEGWTAEFGDIICLSCRERPGNLILFSEKKFQSAIQNHVCSTKLPY